MVISITVIAKERYLPGAEKQFPANIYWGDTHLVPTNKLSVFFS